MSRTLPQLYYLATGESNPQARRSFSPAEPSSTISTTTFADFAVFTTFTAADHDPAKNIVLYRPELPIPEQLNRVGLIQATWSLSERIDMGRSSDASSDGVEFDMGDDLESERFMIINTNARITGVMKCKNFWFALGIHGSSTEGLKETLYRALEIFRLVHSNDYSPQVVRRFFEKWVRSLDVREIPTRALLDEKLNVFVPDKQTSALWNTTVCEPLTSLSKDIMAVDLFLDDPRCDSRQYVHFVPDIDTQKCQASQKIAWYLGHFLSTRPTGGVTPQAKDAKASSILIELKKAWQLSEKAVNSSIDSGSLNTPRKVSGFSSYDTVSTISRLSRSYTGTTSPFSAIFNIFSRVAEVVPGSGVSRAQVSQSASTGDALPCASLSQDTDQSSTRPNKPTSGCQDPWDRGLDALPHRGPFGRRTEESPARQTEPPPLSNWLGSGKTSSGAAVVGATATSTSDAQGWPVQLFPGGRSETTNNQCSKRAIPAIRHTLKSKASSSLEDSNNSSAGTQATSWQGSSKSTTTDNSSKFPLSSLLQSSGQRGGHTRSTASVPQTSSNSGTTTQVATATVLTGTERACPDGRSESRHMVLQLGPTRGDTNAFSLSDHVSQGGGAPSDMPPPLLQNALEMFYKTHCSSYLVRLDIPSGPKSDISSRSPVLLYRISGLLVLVVVLQPTSALDKVFELRGQIASSLHRTRLHRIVIDLRSQMSTTSPRGDSQLEPVWLRRDLKSTARLQSRGQGVGTTNVVHAELKRLLDLARLWRSRVVMRAGEVWMVARDEGLALFDPGLELRRVDDAADAAFAQPAFSATEHQDQN